MPRTTHGMAKVNGRATPTYRVWQEMKNRCLAPSRPNYHRYGGRGITVCDRWMQFESFLSDMGERPKGTELDRIDNDGNYEPGNCRWVTHKQNARNRSDNRMLTADGQTMTLAEWAETTGIRKSTIAGRVRMGWTAEEIVGLVARQGRTWRNDEVEILRRHYGLTCGPAKCAELLPRRTLGAIHQTAQALGIKNRGRP